MSAAARAVGAVLAAAAALALVAASHVPLPVHRSGNALLRVAWSARPERVEVCRTLAEEELAALPQHMRQRVVCEGSTARYRLEVRRDGALLDSATVRGGGLRHDRELYVFRELPVPSGRSTVEVRLVRIDSGAVATAAGADDADLARARSPGDDSAVATVGDRARREVDERRRRDADAVPARLALRETVTLAPREVLLVTYDRGTRRLRTLRGTP